MKKVAFLDTVHEILWNGLTEMGWECVDLTSTEKSAIIECISDFQGIVVRSRFPMDKEFLSHAGQLEFIARSGAGMENIDVDYCSGRGIELVNAPEGNRNAVAEHAVGMLLSLFNHLNKADKEVRSGIWDRESNRGVELEGKTVGIIGYGNNGAATAQVLSGFGCEIIAYDKYKSGFGSDRVEEVDLEEIFKRADVVSFHIPQNEETVYFFDQDFVRKMEKPFYLINLSRGKIVSTEALLDGMQSKKVVGACLDVLEFEKASFEDMFASSDAMPTAFKALIQSKQVILSPHVGGWTAESYRKLSQVLLDKLKRLYS